MGSLGVVTALAATTGAASGAAGWREERHLAVWSTFWSAYRASLRPMLRLNLVALAVLVVGAVDLLFVSTQGFASLPGLFALAAGVLAVSGVFAVGLVTGVRRGKVLYDEVQPAADGWAGAGRAALLVAAHPVRAVGLIALLGAVAVACAVVVPLIPLAVPVVMTAALRMWGRADPVERG
jgi:hypothetical protein